MPVNLYGKLVKAFSGTGGIADASNIETTGSSNVQTEIDNIDGSILHWRFNANITDATNPGASFLAINNALKDDATIISFNTTSNIDSARFTEQLKRLNTNDAVFLQQRNAINRSILYRVTGPATIDGTKVNVPVIRERDQGDEFDNEADLNVLFFAKGSADSLRMVRDINASIITVNATDATTFAASLSGLTIAAGEGFRVATAGEPFTGFTVKAEIGDIIYALVDSPSLTTVSEWGISRRAVDLPVDTDDDAFLDAVTPSGADFNLGSNIKLGTENFNSELTADYARLHAGQGGPTSLSSAMQSLQSDLTLSHVAGTTWTLADSPPSHRATITRKFAAYWDEARNGGDPFTGNYFEDLADPTITLTGDNYFYDASTKDDITTNNRFPGKQSYFTGKLDVNGLPLTNTFTKIIGFSHHISHQLPTGDTPLLRAGSRELIGVDADGLYLLQGNSDGTLVTANFNQRLPLTGNGNTIGYLQGVGASSVEFDALETTPEGNTVSYPLALTLRWKRIQGGSPTSTVTSSFTITDRDVSQTETSEVISIPTLPSGNADETIKFSYNGTTHVLTISTDGISTNTTQDVTQLGMEVTFADSTQINTSSTSSKVRFSTQHDQVGNTVDILIGILATNPVETSADKFLTIKAIIDGHQENNEDLRFRASAYDFSNLIFGPDTTDNVAISNIQVYEWDDAGVPFDAPTHNQLYNFYQNRNSWLGIFIHPNNDHRVYTIDGNLVVTREDDSTLTVGNIRQSIVYQATGVGTGVGELVDSIDLPSSYSDFNYLTVTIRKDLNPNPEWRSVVIPTSTLADGDIAVTDLIRVQGDTDLNWDSSTRTLSTAGSEQEIYLVGLFRIV